MWQKIFKTFVITLSSLAIYILLNFFGSEYAYKFSNSDASFTFEAIPRKSRDLDMMKAVHASFIKAHPDKDSMIYRSFSKKYWKFWQWYDYLQDDYYKYPYMKWDEIKKRQGKIREMTSFQDF